MITKQTTSQSQFKFLRTKVLNNKYNLGSLVHLLSCWNLQLKLNLFICCSMNKITRSKAARINRAVTVLQSGGESRAGGYEEPNINLNLCGVLV